MASKQTGEHRHHRSCLRWPNRLNSRTSWFFSWTKSLKQWRTAWKALLQKAWETFLGSLCSYVSLCLLTAVTGAGYNASTLRDAAKGAKIKARSLTVVKLLPRRVITSSSSSSIGRRTSPQSVNSTVQASSPVAPSNEDCKLSQIKSPPKMMSGSFRIAITSTPTSRKTAIA